MNKRLFLTGVLSAVAMFIWSGIAQALPLGEVGIQQIDKEEPLLNILPSTLSEPGLYMYPKMPSGTPEADYQKRSPPDLPGCSFTFPPATSPSASRWPLSS